MNEHLYAVIMAGGGGTRLWPLSRRAHPKQALNLIGDRTMFQFSVDRLLPLVPAERIFVVTAADQAALLATQVPELPQENFVIEPMGRGTASCIGLSALHLHHRDPDAVMIVVTADHFIQREDAFRDALQSAQAVAEQGYLVTLGIEPTFPSTGYGYIRRGKALGQLKGHDFYEVQQFLEKPDQERAQEFLAQGTYSWNSGMFIWRTSRILEEITHLMPDLHDTLNALGASLGTSDYEQVLSLRWPKLQKETIDYGIMEKADQVAVIPVDIGWTDIGAWTSVMTLHKADAAGNVLMTEAVSLDTTNTMVFSEGERLVATIGVEDLIVIDTPDALLIARADQVQRVRDIVNHLKAEGKETYL